MFIVMATGLCTGLSDPYIGTNGTQYVNYTRIKIKQINKNTQDWSLTNL